MPINYPIPPWIHGVSAAEMGQLAGEGARIGEQISHDQAEEEHSMAQIALESARMQLSAQQADQKMQVEQEQLDQAAQQAAMGAQVKQEQNQRQFLIDQQREEVAKAYQQQQIDLKRQDLEMKKSKIADAAKKGQDDLLLKAAFNTEMSAAQTDDEKRAVAVKYGITFGKGIDTLIPRPVVPKPKQFIQTRNAVYAGDPNVGTLDKLADVPMPEPRVGKKSPQKKSDEERIQEMISKTNAPTATPSQQPPAATRTDSPQQLEIDPSERGRRIFKENPNWGHIRRRLDNGPENAGANVFENESSARDSGAKAGDIVTLMIDGKPTKVRLR